MPKSKESQPHAVQLKVLAALVRMNRPSIRSIAEDVGISESAAKRAMISLRDHWGVKWSFQRGVRALDGGTGSYRVDDLGPFSERGLIQCLSVKKDADAPAPASAAGQKKIAPDES